MRTLAAEMSPEHEALWTFTRGYADVSPAAWEQVAPHWTPWSCAPGEAVLREGEHCDYVWFLAEGLMRYASLRPDGTEATKYFTEPPYVFTATRSFEAQTPSRESIHAVLSGRGLRMSRADAYALIAREPAFATFVRCLVQEVQGFTDDLLVEATTLTAEERYRALLTERPGLVAQCPLKYLASYLGVAPQSLSRIRARVAG